MKLNKELTNLPRQKGLKKVQILTEDRLDILTYRTMYPRHKDKCKRRIHICAEQLVNSNDTLRTRSVWSSVLGRLKRQTSGCLYLTYVEESSLNVKDSVRTSSERKSTFKSSNWSYLSHSLTLYRCTSHKLSFTKTSYHQEEHSL